MKLIDFIGLYDSWNMTVVINNDSPEYHIRAKIIDLMLNSETKYRDGTLNKQVISFSFKDNELHIRTK